MLTYCHVESQKLRERLHKSCSCSEELVGALLVRFDCLGAAHARQDLIAVDAASAQFAGVGADHDFVLRIGHVRSKWQLSVRTG